MSVSPAIRLSTIQETLLKALAFIEKHGLDTYDPQDLRGTPLVIKTWQHQSILRRALRQLIYACGFLSPIITRKILSIKPCATAGGNAILSTAYGVMARLGDRETNLQKARMLLNWLAAHSSPTTVGKGWGLPYDWFSRTVIPRETPNLHTTVYVGRAFLSYYKATGDQWSLDYARQAGEWIITCPNQIQRPSGTLGLSYTKLDRSLVINTNAEAAEFLLSLGSSIQSDHFIHFGLMILDFILKQQNSIGSWYYYDIGITETDFSIDGYHTGMIIKALLKINIYLQDLDIVIDNIDYALDSAMRFYLDNLFDKSNIPVTFYGKQYPMDIYSFGQAILTLIEAVNYQKFSREIRVEAITKLHCVIRNVLRLMYDPDGSFIYRRYRFKAMRLYSLRWAQALMCLALAEYYYNISSGLIPSHL